jgi:hypothetical protein
MIKNRTEAAMKLRYKNAFFAIFMELVPPTFFIPPAFPTDDIEYRSSCYPTPSRQNTHIKVWCQVSHPPCPPPLFNLHESQGAEGPTGPLGEDSSAAPRILRSSYIRLGLENFSLPLFFYLGIQETLRQIGKRSLFLNEAAIRTAREIEETNSKAAKWIASNALRELTGEKIRKKWDK